MNSFDDILYEVSRPARYSGGEWNSRVKDWQAVKLHIALAFPDVYEIGMSNMALPILYKIINDQSDALAERAFAPWVDMEELLRKNNLPLLSLETRRPLKDFDVIGFSLGYELTYTNVLNMLDLAKIPLFSNQRNDSYPLIIAGGSCALNPEPMADFIDLFVIGEAEEIIVKLLGVFRNFKGNKEKLLEQAAGLPGVYVPSFYEVSYHQDGTLAGIEPRIHEARIPIERQIIPALLNPVTDPVVPHVRAVHDRGAVEIQRGCSRGCRFCQAGMIYRPVRELPQKEIIDAVCALVKNCGHSEISLVSLSTGDYHDISELIGQLSSICSRDNLSLSLPSLRIDASSINLIESLPHRRKTTLTFAPEAGTERLRRAMNKYISEEEMFAAFASAFEKGWFNLKLYFMVGLPTETMDDVKGIVDLVARTSQLGRKLRSRSPGLRVSVATFVPKAHTPCQWAAQNNEDELILKHELLKQGFRRLGVRFSWQDTKTSQLEAVLSRGDRRLGKVIHRAWELGNRFDAWHECFNYDNWSKAFLENGLDPAFYANRERALNEILPWQHIDIGVTRNFLLQEYKGINSATDTGDCRHGSCNACGLQKWHLDCRQKFKKRNKLI
jgi:radical SAM family uncharacterized protein